MDIGKELRVIEVTEERLQPAPPRPPRTPRPTVGKGAAGKAPAAAPTEENGSN